MRGYAASHQLLDGVGASIALVLAAAVSGDRWLRFPQLVDGFGRGVPLGLLFIAGFGSVVMVINPYPVLAFERIRLGRALVPLDVASFALLLGPALALVLVGPSLGFDADVVRVVLRDVAAMVVLTAAVAAIVPSREAAALAPVLYVLALGLLGTSARGDIRPWAALLERSTNVIELVVVVVAALATGVLVDARLRRRALAGWAATGG